MVLPTLVRAPIVPCSPPVRAATVRDNAGGLKGSVHHPDVEEVLTPVVVGAQLKVAGSRGQLGSGVESRCGRGERRGGEPEGEA